MKKATRVIVAAMVLLLFVTAIPAFAQSGKPDQRVKKALDALKITYEVAASGNFKVIRDMADGERTHLVIVASSTSNFRGTEVREVYGVAAKFDYEPDADLLYRLLTESYTYKIGSWAMSEEDGTYYISFIARVYVNISNTDLQNTIDAVAMTCDQWENELMDGTDDF